ncbi:ATP-binding protein [Candidatus Parvarchaeota archaeon]|nr:ATP-binding protein [Candidatus Parvarchaeota archaeon]
MDDNDGGTEIMPFARDFCEETETAIKKEIDKVIRSRPSLKEILDSSQAIKSAAKPVFSRKKDGPYETLCVTVACPTKPERQDHTLSKLLQVVGDSNSTTGIIYPSITTTISTSVSKTSTVNVLDTSASGYKLFSVSYIRIPDTESGVIRIELKPKLLMDVELARDIFMQIWSDVVMDRERVGLTEKSNISEEKGLSIFKSKASMENVGGYDALKQQIQRDIIYPFIHNQTMKKITKTTRADEDTVQPNAVLFYGMPGTGKTLMARVLAGQNSMDFIVLNPQKIFSAYYSESPKRLKEALDYAEAYSKEHGKTILFIDEIDYFGTRNVGQSTDKEDARALDTILVKLDGLSNNKESNLLVIGATNFYDALDPALLSRFKSKIFFDMPTKDDRVAIWRLYAKHLPNEDLERLAYETEGLVGRDILNIADKAERMLCSDIVNDKTKNTAPDLGYYRRGIIEFKAENSGKAVSKAPSGLYR